ncbi:hypothetical protein ACWCQM_11215 [Streptomyces sp. NPDC002125]
MSANDLTPAQQLLAAIHNLNMADYQTDPTGQPVVRLTIRTMDGEFVGEVQLGQRATTETTNAVSVVAEYALAKPSTPDLHPKAVADLIDMFDNLDLVDLTKSVLNAVTPTGRLAATQAIDDMFGHIPHPGAENGDL